MLGELARIDTKKFVDDQRVTNLLKKMIVDAETTNDSSLGVVLQPFLPTEMSREDIIGWIKENVDFSNLKNKMMAVGIAKKALGTNADGKLISQVVREETFDA